MMIAPVQSWQIGSKNAERRLKATFLPSDKKKIQFEKLVTKGVKFSLCLVWNTKFLISYVKKRRREKVPEIVQKWS